MRGKPGSLEGFLLALLYCRGSPVRVVAYGSQMINELSGQVHLSVGPVSL